MPWWCVTTATQHVFPAVLLQYIHPGDSHKLEQAELVCVDEAAAIPLPLVKKLLGPYLVFLASTVNGYEGTGRSLSLKLLEQLRQQSSLTGIPSASQAATSTGYLSSFVHSPCLLSLPSFLPSPFFLYHECLLVARSCVSGGLPLRAHSLCRRGPGGAMAPRSSLLGCCQCSEDHLGLPSPSRLRTVSLSSAFIFIHCFAGPLQRESASVEPLSSGVWWAFCGRSVAMY